MKVIKNAPDSSAMLIAASDYTQMTSGPNSISCSADAGNFVNGPLSISSQVDSIKVGGIFRFNPILASCLPSTMITPLPTLVMDVPIRNLASMGAIAGILAGLA